MPCDPVTNRETWVKTQASCRCQKIQGCTFLQSLILSSIQINQLEADLQELGSLLEKAERKRVQELLKQEQKKVEKELSVKRQQKEQQARRAADPSAASKAMYTVKITNYGMVPLFRKTAGHSCECRGRSVHMFASSVQLGTSPRNSSKFTSHWRMCTQFHQRTWKSTLQKGKLVINIHTYTHSVYYSSC